MGYRKSVYDTVDALFYIQVREDLKTQAHREMRKPNTNIAEMREVKKGKLNMKKERMLPINLQFFAENPDDGEHQEQQTEPESELKESETTNAPDENVPDMKALNEQLQASLVEQAKQKRVIDKLTKELGDVTKKYRATLTEQELASQEKAEAEARKQEEYESMKKTLKVNELTENFMDLGYEKVLAKEAATAQVDGDTEKLLSIQKKFQDKQRKQWEADFLKSRPEINAGAGTTQTISKEAFDKMSLMERTKLKRENKAEYDRLIAL